MTTIYDESGVPVGFVQPHPIECERAEQPVAVQDGLEYILKNFNLPVPYVHPDSSLKVYIPPQPVEVEALVENLMEWLVGQDGGYQHQRINYPANIRSALRKAAQVSVASHPATIIPTQL